MNVLASIIVVTNLAYLAAFDTETRCPSWNYYVLDPCEIVVTNRAANSFRADPRVPESDLTKDYAKSGYDRGHLAPAADFNFDREALKETYLFTNIAPQEPTMNRGEWAEVEREVRTLAASGSVHVLTVPVFDGRPARYMGRVRVPDAFEKTAFGYFGILRWRVENHDVTLQMGACLSAENTKKKEGTK